MSVTRLPNALRLAYAVALLGLAGHVAHATGLGKPGLDYLFENIVYTTLMAFAAASCGLRAVLVRRERSVWTAFALALGFWAIGDALWDFYFGVADEPPFPNVADGFYFASYAAQYVGLVLLLRARLRPWRLSIWLDGLIAGLAAAALAATVIFPAILRATEGDALAVGVTLAYPLLDCLSLCFVVLAFALCAWRPAPAWQRLGIGFTLTAVADALYNYLTATGAWHSGTLISSLWPAGALLISSAAWQPSRGRTAHSGGLAGAAITAGAAAVAMGVLVGELLGRDSTVGGALALAAVALVVGRCLLTLRENDRILAASDREALTDALSGLPNRRKLLRDLDDACDAGAPTTLAFFDLDGFKSYNDLFGHGAGDSLLSRLGGELASAMHGRGVAYRLGGDEFCVLLDGDVGRGDPALREASAALTERGEQFSVTASFGVVTMPADTDRPEEAMRLADERMYTDKRGGRTSSRAQTTDVLLAALREREPGLGDHHDHVAQLARAVALGLGCDAEQVDEITRAATLHDLGKVAIPDAIVGKPGALDAAEWEYMRQHTIIAERILASAPALRPVARIIRSSHERFDGTGYPDRLAGEAIPLAARVVAVCDAFEAMCEERPYQRARPHAAALAELRRCAGTQFDPGVVAMFERVLEGHPRTGDAAVAGR